MKVIFLLLNIHLVLGQAPGDFQEICRTDFRYRTLHDWIPYVNDTTIGVRGAVKWQILVDQNDYQHILGMGVGSSPVWMRRDIDEDGRQIESSGTICTNSLQIRDTYKNPNSNNWVFTQSVSYLDAIEVIVNATVRFRGCQQRSSSNPPCRNNFVVLHCYDTNSTRASNMIMNTDNYQPCFGNTMKSRFEDSSGSNAISVIKRFARPNFDMTYFGIQDIGSYGDVQRMLVYYRVAQGYEEGLVRCPTIALPREGSSDTVTKSCTCKENAIPMGNMQLSCRENGACQGSPMCQCRAGYQGQSDCQACSSGTYRSLDRTRCEPCPQQSTSGVAASNCSCVEGTYRARTETGHASCTTPPSEPRSLTEESSNVTCTIRWAAPSDKGRRTDTSYSITYMEEGSISGSSSPITTTNRSYVIRNLKPVTTYQIRVTAENGVSANEVSLDQLNQRTATVTCTTTEGVPEKPSGVQVIDNLLLIWQKPNTTNGVITRYVVNITFTPFHNPITRNLSQTRFYFVFRQNEIPENVTAHVKVRARTASHIGKWSDVISFDPSPASSPTSVTQVVAVVGDMIIMDIPTSVLNKIDKFEVQIISGDEQSTQTKEPIIFMAENTGQPLIKIPSDQLSTLKIDSTYSVKVKPLFINNTQGEYGSFYTFQFTGATSNTLTSTGEGQVDKKFIALAVVLTFLVTAIIVTLLVLALVWLFMTCRKKKSAKQNGTDKPINLGNFYGNKENGNKN